MKIRDLRQKSQTENERTIQEKRSHLLSLRFDLSGGRVKNIREIRETKKDIAKILTLLKAWQKS